MDYRAAIVTGGAHGLGRAMVLALAKKGLSVIAADVSEDNLSALRSEAPENVFAMAADVSDARHMQNAVDSCCEHFGRIDMVVNNAGISQWTLRPDRVTNPVRFWQLSANEIGRFLGIHTLGPVLLSQAALPHFLNQGWGRIVTVTTSHDTMLAAGQAPYGPAKAASEAFAAIMSNELADSGVTVNVLTPGGVARTHPERKRGDTKPLLDPSVMAPPIAWLASEESDGTSGRHIIASRWDIARSGEDNIRLASVDIGWHVEETAVPPG